MPTIRVYYDGQFAEVTDCHREHVLIEEGGVHALLQKLVAKYGKGFSDMALDSQKRDIAPGISILSDGRRLGLEDRLSEGAEVVFLVSFAGG